MKTLKGMFTTRNVGTADRIVRALLTPLVIGLYAYGILPLGWAIGLGVLAVMLLATSVLGSCSIYYMLGFSTCPISGKPKPGTSS
jgi:hypothetical protein